MQRDPREAVTIHEFSALRRRLWVETAAHFRADADEAARAADAMVLEFDKRYRWV